MSKNNYSLPTFVDGLHEVHKIWRPTKNISINCVETNDRLYLIPMASDSRDNDHDWGRWVVLVDSLLQPIAGKMVTIAGMNNCSKEKKL